MKYTIIQECLDILKKEDVKKEFRMLLSPIFEIISYEINPYIYIIIILIFIILIIILANLIILISILRNNQITHNI
jgi:hypothetical protein